MGATSGARTVLRLEERDGPGRARVDAAPRRVVRARVRRGPGDPPPFKLERDRVRLTAAAEPEREVVEDLELTKPSNSICPPSVGHSRNGLNRVYHLGVGHFSTSWAIVQRENPSLVDRGHRLVDCVYLRFFK